MKNKILLLRCAAIFVFSPSFMQGQSLSAKVFFNTDSISAIYLGIDFTLAKLINDVVSNATIIQSQQFSGINELIVKEYKKYDVQKAYHRASWTVDTREVEAENKNYKQRKAAAK
jgi:hypothetical protein